MKPTLTKQSDFEYQVGLSQQVPWKKLNGTIWKVEILTLAHVICKPLYDELISQSEGDSLTAENQTLVTDYIVPYVVEASYADYLKGANSHSTISGMRFIQGDNTGDTDNKKVSDLIKVHEYNAEGFKGMLVAFLDANSDTYPLYKECCNDSMRKPSFMFGSVESAEQKYMKDIDKYYRDSWQYLDDGRSC